MPGLGTLVNLGAIIVGTALGLIFGSAISQKMRTSATQVIGLSVIVIGIAGALSALGKLGVHEGPLGKYASIMLVACLVLGTVLGEALHIERGLERLGEWLRDKLLSSRALSEKTKEVAEGTDDDAHGNVLVEGFVTASLIYAVGAMTILGSIQDGLGDPSTLFLKSALDGLTSIFLASTLGIGVGLSVIPVLGIQGAIVLFTLFAGNIVPTIAITALEAVGGVIIAAIGLNILDIKRLPVGNMLPALVLALASGWLLG